jgi:CDP-glucose 4,6-dehydratase
VAVRQGAMGRFPAMITTMGRLPDPVFWQDRRVLLTGHTGFKGAWLGLWLRALGASVTGLSLSAEPGSLAERIGIGDRVQSRIGDIRAPQAVHAAFDAAQPEIVLHLAAQALVRRSYADPVETFATNVMGTVHLLDAMRRAPNVGAAVIVTTDKCYENRDWAWPYREADRLGGRDPYSASKACAELAVGAWRQAFAEGPATASARAGNVIGGGDFSADRLVPDCIRAFAAGQPVRLRNPAATRPWQHVLEPLCGYLLLAERLWHEGVAFATAWNFGPAAEDVQPVAAVVDQLARLWGEGAQWTADPGPHPHEAGQLAVDAALARQRLHWRPRLSLGEGVRWTADWYRQERAGTPAAELVLRDIARYSAAA